MEDSRGPEPLDVLAFAMGKMLSPIFIDYSDKKSEQRQSFEINQFHILEECDSLPTPIKLFDISLMKAHDVISSRENAFGLLLIQNTRQSLLSRYSWSPVKETITDEISNFQSSDLFYIMNKSGITYSYTEDEKRHTESKNKVDKDRSSILLKFPSNWHQHQIDNLETHMHYVLMLSTNKKLLHFMRQQLVYVNEFNPCIDFFQGQPSYLE